MRIGYACINMSIGCSSARTFRLKSYSEARLISTISENLECLKRIIRFNVDNGILFFRITSDLIPFASHPVMKFNWQEHFSSQLSEIGEMILSAGMRVSMHPGQYTVLNSRDERIYKNAVNDLQYHCKVFDLMRMGPDAKVQIHVGGVYGNKTASIERFAKRHQMLDKDISRRLVIENDDRSFSLADCFRIHELTRIPVVFDNLHHDVINNGESLQDGLKSASLTWSGYDGPPIVHYSSQSIDGRPGKHSATLDAQHFRKFLKMTQEIEFDLMLEIKDKDISALKALDIYNELLA